MRIRITLAYDGSAYSGWQIQEKPNPPPTIQGALEAALFALAGQKIRVFAAGRTDAGVHAIGQCAHFDAPARNWDWRNRLNALLPHDIRVLTATPASPDFHARRSAISKTYSYAFWQEPAWTPPFLSNRVWSCGPLDFEVMEQALQHFRGRRDFASFRNLGTPTKSTVREIFDARLELQPPLAHLPRHRQPILLVLTGDGFLKQMVRNIAGFLAAVARGRLMLSELPAIFAARERRALPSATAPASGLVLLRVQYPDLTERINPCAI